MKIRFELRRDRWERSRRVKTTKHSLQQLLFYLHNPKSSLVHTLHKKPLSCDRGNVKLNQFPTSRFLHPFVLLIIDKLSIIAFM
jgi:hypothetical protein